MDGNRERQLVDLLWEALQRLDMASALAKDEHLAQRYAATSDKIRAEVARPVA